MKAVLQIILHHRTVRILLIFALILASAIAFIANNTKNPFVDEIDELSKQLITISGIFTALMLTILMPFFLERAAERRTLVNEYKNECKKLAAFRSFTYYIKFFDMFKSSSALQAKYLKGRSLIDYRNSSEIDAELWELVNSEQVRGEDIERMDFYGAIRDFSYNPPYETGMFTKYSDYIFSYEKLEYMHECCRSIWYSLDKHKYLRDAFDNSYAFHSTYWIQRMEEVVPAFSTERTKTPLKKPSQFLMNQAGEYEQVIQTMLNKLYKILYELSPQSFTFISTDTVYILAFGIIIPLYTLLFRIPTIYNQVIGLACFSITITFIVNFLFDMHAIFNKDSFKDTYEDEEYPLFPKDQF